MTAPAMSAIMAATEWEAGKPAIAAVHPNSARTLPPLSLSWRVGRQTLPAKTPLSTRMTYLSMERHEQHSCLPGTTYVNWHELAITPANSNRPAVLRCGPVAIRLGICHLLAEVEFPQLIGPDLDFLGIVAINGGVFAVKVRHVHADLDPKCLLGLECSDGSGVACKVAPR